MLLVVAACLMFRNLLGGAGGERESGHEAAGSEPKNARSPRAAVMAGAGGRAAAKRGSHAPSPGLLALRDANAAKDPWKLHENIQKFETGEFEEVWSLLLGMPDGGWKTQEMGLAVTRAANLGLLDDALKRILADLPAGTGRESLLTQAFSAAKADLAMLVSRAATFTDSGEKAAVYAGLATRIGLSNSLAELDPAFFEGATPELLDALAKGLGKFPSAYTLDISPEEMDSKMADAMALAGNLVGSGLAEESFVSTVIAELSQNRVAQVWSFLEESRPGLLEGNPDILRPVLSSMIRQEPQEVLALSLEHPWIEAAALRGATLNWLFRDSAKAREWHDAHAASLSPAGQDQVAAGFVEFHSHRGNPDEALRWIQRIADPELRDDLNAQLNRPGRNGY